MKTLFVNPDSKSRAAERRRKLVSYLTLGTLLFLARAACAADVTWRANAVDHDWNNPSNWSTRSVPEYTDNAIFDVSNIHDIEIPSQFTKFVQDIIFSETADAFTLVVTDGAFLQADDVTNNSAVEQNLIAESNGIFSVLGDVTEPVTFTAEPSDSATEVGGALAFGTSTGTATIHNLGANVPGAVGGGSYFSGGDSVEGSTIINDGATVAGASGGSCTFDFGFPTAGNATLIANGGSNGGGGGFFIFDHGSTGGTARVELFGNGYLDISPHGPRDPMTIGSLEGDGMVYLGDNTLTIVANGLDTTFSGLLLPGDPTGGPGTGALIKSGSTALTLSGANLYTAGTTVSAGTLIVSNTTGSATGTGAVLVNAGTLGGGGTIAGAVEIGTGSGAGAFLAPAAGANKQLTLAIESSVTLNSDATYTYTFKAKKNKSRADLIVADGVTINGAMVNLVGQTQGSLKLGLTLTMITNRSANPISGTFANLPDGGIVNVNGNNLQASYEGGDGNDLTLTVVP